MCVLKLEKPLRKKQEWANEKPKLDNARKLRGFYFIHREHGEYQEAKKTQEKVGSSDGGGNSLQKRNQEAFWGFRKLKRGDEFNKLPTSKRACVVEAHESMRVSTEKIMKIKSKAKDTIR